MLVFITGACASSDRSSNPAEDTTTSTRSQATADAQRIADAGLVTQADVPAGFVGRPKESTSTEESDRRLRATPACEPFEALTEPGLVRAHSKEYGLGQGRVFDSVAMFATRAEAASQLELFTDPRIVDCIQGRFERTFKDANSSLPEGVTVSGVNISPLAIDPYGDGTFGFRATITLTEGGAPQIILTDIVGVQVGRAAVTVQSTGDTSADLAQLETTVIPKIVARLRAAGA